MAGAFRGGSLHLPIGSDLCGPAERATSYNERIGVRLRTTFARARCAKSVLPRAALDQPPPVQRGDGHPFKLNHWPVSAKKYLAPTGNNGLCPLVQPPTSAWLAREVGQVQTKRDSLINAGEKLAPDSRRQSQSGLSEIINIHSSGGPRSSKAD